MDEPRIVEIGFRLNGVGIIDAVTGLFVEGLLFTTEKEAEDYADAHDWIVQD